MLLSNMISKAYYTYMTNLGFIGPMVLDIQNKEISQLDLDMQTQDDLESSSCHYMMISHCMLIRNLKEFGSRIAQSD